MQKLNQKQLVVVIVVVVAVIAAAAIAYTKYAKTHKATTTATQQTKDLKQQVAKTEVDKSKLPDNFPADIPLEKNATVTQNYNATTKEGITQATRGFVTTQTLEANAAIYKDFFSKSGYSIANNIDKPDYKMLYAIKGNQSVQVSISHNTVNQNNTVVISYLQTKVNETNTK